MKVKVTPPIFKLDLCFVATSIVYKFHIIWWRRTKIRERKRQIHHFFLFVNRHNSRIVKVMPHKFKLGLFHIVINIVYKTNKGHRLLNLDRHLVEYGLDYINRSNLNWSGIGGVNCINIVKYIISTCDKS